MTNYEHMSEEEKKLVRDCHYCEQAMCENTEGTVDCYGEDNCYFDHHVKDSKEAEDCEFFSYCDIFPKC